MGPMVISADRSGRGGGPGLDINPFGRFAVTRDAHEVNLGTARQRALFALLVTSANQAVSMDAIIESIWGQSPPSRVKASIQAYVSRLRKSLSANAFNNSDRTPRFEYYSAGYSLRIDIDQVRTHHFEKLVDNGRRLLTKGPLEGAAENFERALEIWDGVPYGDLFRYEFATQEAARLEELRLAAVAGMAKCRLELGDYRSVTESLGPDVRRYPLREDLASYYMVALDQSGRRADALHIYERTRSNLAEELGVGVSKGLRSVYHAILD
ncbi:DNA-binding transcriptional activator of the SARP family [Streptomyces sp. yr375]|uniref:AfsR/SARP family transcriptional regulator n=1 Tax=Streptomyces sp. yr375 TaxID=1761906 RepID=UPI0008BE8E27|nr:AfsR/SARP family transcriptional regulator [Streptomyces sp. yr375]SEP93243.1 DNA-binding transcriptional activator of the SARP family [Streptomyces sp. yr375]